VRINVWKTSLPILERLEELAPRGQVPSESSLSVERAAKSLDDKVADKSRNRNSKDKRTVLLRVGLNLRLKRESLQFEGCS
jgi:hypothetical protein